MKLLLDTHAFLFAIGEPAQLPLRVRDLLADPAIERWVSTISLWEIAVKAAMGKLSVPTDRGFFIRHLDALRAKVLAVELRHSLALLELPLHHKDPFDRLLIAQALEEGMTITSRDQVFDRYGAPVIW
jgi:PIN domain nuclease of toxin-antitoxin system